MTDTVDGRRKRGRGIPLPYDFDSETARLESELDSIDDFLRETNRKWDAGKTNIFDWIRANIKYEERKGVEGRIKNRKFTRQGKG